MKLPNLSFMMSVGEVRYIQSHFESGEYRNPDAMVGAFLSTAERLRCLIKGTVLRSRARANPFYPYVVARTKHYDEVFLGAAQDGARAIFNIGCGSDTRAHRFAEALARHQVQVFECDQADAIGAKERIAVRRLPGSHVKYAAIDLNEGGWPTVSARLGEGGGAVLIMMEGVSPYVNTTAFETFLAQLAGQLAAGSRVAYDFKLSGVADDFGRSARSQQLFRLPRDKAEITRYHQALGYQVQQVEFSDELTRRLVPHAAAVFEEDGLVKLVTRAPALA